MCDKDAGSGESRRSVADAFLALQQGRGFRHYLTYQKLVIVNNKLVIFCGGGDFLKLINRYILFT